jgi:hypothetical protein
VPFVALGDEGLMIMPSYLCADMVLLHPVFLGPVVHQVIGELHVRCRSGVL